MDEGDAEEVLTWALGRHDGGHRVALATVIETWGSAPRPAGSQLAVDAQGAHAGSVSGGCVEGAVLEAAQTVMRDGTPQLLEFGVSHEQAWEVGLACGGRVRVHVAPLSPAGVEREALDALRAVQRARARRQPVALASWLDSGARRALSPDAATASGDAVASAAALALRRDQAQRVDSVDRAAGPVFVQPFNPRPRMVIVGAVHIAQALSLMARLNGFDVSVVDPRRAFASEARFPNVALLHAFPDEALAALALDARCAVVTLTHDPKLDEPALRAALASDAFYVGALGSRRTHAARVKRLQAAGVSQPDIARVHGPVGLAIGAASAAEIATSIMAQAIAALRGATL